MGTNALIDRNDLEVQSEDDSTANDTSVEEGEEPSTSLIYVDGGRDMIHEATKDETIGNVAIATPMNSPMKTDLDEFIVPGERGEVSSGSGIARPISPTSKTDYVDDEVSEEPAHIAQASPSAPIEIPSSASSLSAPESDQGSDEALNQESDNASHQESNSLFDEQSESGQSNAAMYSGPPSELGLDGSTFSRLPPAAESSPSLSVIKRLEEGPEVDSPNTDNAQDIPSSLQSDVEQIGSKAEEPSISLESYDTAQRRWSVQLPSSDQVRSPEAGELDDEATKDPVAAQLLADDGGSWKDADILKEDDVMQRSSSNPPTTSNQSESQKFREELELRSQEIPDSQAALESVPEKRPANFLEERSLSSSREEEDLSEASDEENTLETSPEKDPAHSAVRQESPHTRQRELVPNARLFRDDSNISLLQRQGTREGAEGVGRLTTKVQQTTVEIIDLENDDEDVDAIPQNFSQEALQSLANKKDPEFARTVEVSAHETIISVIPEARNGRHTSTPEGYRPSTFPDSTSLVLNPVAAIEEFPPADIYVEPKSREEPEEQASGKQSPVPKIKEYEEELPFREVAPPKQSPEARPDSHERELVAEKEDRLKQPPTAGTEPKPVLADNLPLPVPDSFEDTRSESQLPTPSSTQQTNCVSQPSSVSVHSAPEGDTLPTPRLTQGTSAGIWSPEPLAPSEGRTPMETLAPPKKTSALIEKLKEMRRLSYQSPKPRSSDASILDPWFAPKRLSQVVPDSEDESEAESSPERAAPAESLRIAGRQMAQTPEKPLAKSFIRSPPQRNHMSSINSSPQYLPPSQPPPPGFRTNLSYFVPLATLSSHLATNVDILAIALSSTPVTRATSGPRDYNQTLYTTDPSSSASRHPITTAQIFRPNNRCFPLVEEGDALLLRDFKVHHFQKRLSLLSTESSAWAVFRKGVDVQMRGPPVEFGAEERGFARGLWDWWASLGDDARKRFGNAVPEYKKPNGTAKTTKSKGDGNKSDARIKQEEIEGLGVDLPGSQTKRRESVKERSLSLEGMEERDMVHESVEAPKRVLRARGAKGANGRSESARESRFGTVFTGGLGEPDETQGSAHELRDGKAYRDKRR